MLSGQDAASTSFQLKPAVSDRGYNGEAKTASGSAPEILPYNDSAATALRLSGWL
jgi:hypothetical protein